MIPNPGDVLEYPPSGLILVVVRRYPTMLGERLGEEVEVLWLAGHAHTNELISKHRAHPDTWDGWVKL
jgi:hypothetical protein